VSELGIREVWMAPDDPRLSQLTTQWTLLVRSHQRSDPAAAHEAQADLLPRYCAAIYRYLLAVVRDSNVADDLCQEFALRFVRGDFRHARPDKGRFRDYLKVSIVRLAREYKAGSRDEVAVSAGELKAAGVDEGPAALLEAAFDAECRRDMLNRTWGDLKEATAGPPPTMYDVLRLKCREPSLPSAQLAGKLSTAVGRELSAESVRQMIHRARERFAALLRRQVAAVVGTDDPGDVDAELAALGLLEYVRR
jgi:RNA polymerase sigma-70 factor (ECF subfamily)